MYYAVKTNPSEVLLKDLHGHGVGFDAASKGEIKQLFELGVDPTKIGKNPTINIDQIALQFSEALLLFFLLVDNIAVFRLSIFPVIHKI